MEKALLFTNNSKKKNYLLNDKTTNCKLPKVHDKTVFHERLHRVHLLTEESKMFKDTAKKLEARMESWIGTNKVVFYVLIM